MSSDTFAAAKISLAVVNPQLAAEWHPTKNGKLQSEYVMVITAHYEVAKLLDELPQNKFVVVERKKKKKGGPIFHVGPISPCRNMD